MARKQNNEQTFTNAVEDAVETQPSLSMEKKLLDKFGRKDDGPGNGWSNASSGSTQVMEAPEDWPVENPAFEKPGGSEAQTWSTQTGEVQQRSFGGADEQASSSMHGSGGSAGDLQDAWRQMQRVPRPEGRTQARPHEPLGPTEETIRSTGHGGSGSRLEQQQRATGKQSREQGGVDDASAAPTGASGSSQFQGTGAVTGSSFMPGAPGRPEASGSWSPPTKDRGTRLSTEGAPGSTPVRQANFGQTAGRRTGTADPRIAKQLFEEGLKDIYYGETKLVKALTKMAGQVSDPQIASGFEKHRRTTQQQVERLEQIFEVVGKTPRRKTCHGINGLIDEYTEFASKKPKQALLDLYAVGAALKVEHYEIATYRGLIELANQAQVDGEAVDLLQESLSEEENEALELEGMLQQQAA